MRTTRPARRGTRPTTTRRRRQRIVPRDAGHRGQRVLSRLSGRDCALVARPTITTCVRVPLVGTVKDTIDALLPLLQVKTDTAHLDRMTAHYRRARDRLDRQARPGRDSARLHPQYVAATIDRLAAEDAVFTADVGTPCIWA